jgi:hypothetical protein
MQNGCINMQDDFLWRSPRVSGAVKVNNNRLLEEENLAFIWCGVVGAAVVDDDIVELLSLNHNHDRRRSCCRAPERCWDHRVADVEEIIGLEYELPHLGAS